jgi:hypothetical protein
MRTESVPSARVGAVAVFRSCSDHVGARVTTNRVPGDWESHLAHYEQPPLGDPPSAAGSYAVVMVLPVQDRVRGAVRHAVPGEDVADRCRPIAVQVDLDVGEVVAGCGESPQAASERSLEDISPPVWATQAGSVVHDAIIREQLAKFANFEEVHMPAVRVEKIVDRKPVPDGQKRVRCCRSLHA